jgi:16S rRNA pseudouridine516 synthase
LNVNDPAIKSKHRLDRFISLKKKVNKRDVRLMLAQKRIVVDGLVALSVQQIIQPFSHVMVDGEVIQDNKPSYLMMHKPVGVVSATRDHLHKTVIDLLDHPLKDALHIVGRLDLNSSGLLLLTNDSAWSRRLMSPESKLAKCYQVVTQNPITEAYIAAFQQGMYFSYEDLTTLPVALEITGECEAELRLFEGRYHQIKRMFGRFRNPVLSIHRTAIGDILLDDSLPEGGTRALTAIEITSVLGPVSFSE